MGILTSEIFFYCVEKKYFFAKKPTFALNFTAPLQSGYIVSVFIS
jgi:hypothetical protein